MADYHAILKRAISAMPSPTGEARRAVYEKARNALVNQLKSFDPPLPASEITQQRLQLEDAIRKVESEAARGLLRAPPPPPVAPAPEPATEAPAAETEAPPPAAPPQPQSAAPQPTAPAAPKPAAPAEPTAEPSGHAAPSPVPAPLPGSPVKTVEPGEVPPSAVPRAEPVAPPPLAPTPGSEALKRAVDEAGALGGATAELGRQARDALGESAEATTSAFAREAPAVPPRKAEEKRRRRRREEREGDRPPSRLPLMVGIAVAVLVIGIGVVALWTQREAISAFVGGNKPPVVDLAQRQTPDKLAPKSSDRLAADESARPATPVKPVQTQTITPAPQLQSTQPTAPTQPTTQPATPTDTAAAGTDASAGLDPAKAPPVPAQAVPLVAQKAILYEEGRGGGQAQISPGKVVWSVTPDPTDPKPGAMLLKARVEIPERGFAVALQMHPNSDTSFPASHLIELRFTLAADFDGKAVTNVPGLILKATEQARGDPLIGASAKVSDNFFWIALGSGEQDRNRNLKMLKERGWIDVPILYESGRRAILTLEKAGAGDQAFTDAFAAWGQDG